MQNSRDKGLIIRVIERWTLRLILLKTLCFEMDFNSNGDNETRTVCREEAAEISCRSFFSSLPLAALMISQSCIMHSQK